MASMELTAIEISEGAYYDNISEATGMSELHFGCSVVSDVYPFGHSTLIMALMSLMFDENRARSKTAQDALKNITLYD